MPKQKQIDRKALELLITQRNNTYRIYCSGSKADIVGDKLYSNANIYLDRKYLKFAALHK